MNYEKLYNQIILHAQNAGRKKSKDEYFEKHHIIPFCAGGTNLAENLVLLTAREHVICHILLVKFCKPENLKSLRYAAGMMIRTRGKIISSRMFEIGRKEHRLAISEDRTGKKASAETRAKLSAAGLGRKYVGEQLEHIRSLRLLKPKKPLSEEHRKKLSDSTKGVSKTFSEEHKASLRGPRGPWTEKQREARKACAEKIRLAHVGRKRPAETGKKISEAIRLGAAKRKAEKSLS
jgi:hypothetical protein